MWRLVYKLQLLMRGLRYFARKHKVYSTVPLIMSSALIAIVLTWQYSYRARPELHPEERFELIRALVHYNNDAAELWDNQPALLPVALSSAFKMFGRSLETARYFAAFLFLILASSIFYLCFGSTGMIRPFLALAFLTLSPGILIQLSSLTAEGTMMSLVLASAACLFSVPKPGLIRAAIAGALFGSALAVKLTSGLFLPAMLLAIASMPKPSLETKESITFSNTVAIIVTFTFILLSTFILLGRTNSHNHPFATLTQDFNREALTKQWDSAGYTFDFNHVFNTSAIPLLTILAMWNWLRQSDSTINTFLGTGLLSAAFVHAYHRPYWSYYNIHFYAPLAVLAARVPLNDSPTSNIALTSLKRALSPSIIVVSLIWMVMRPETNFQPAQDNETVRFDTLRLTVQSIPRDSSIYCADPLVVFLSGLRPIPFLALSPARRYWTGEISDTLILDTLQRNPPTVMILKGEQFETNWEQFCHANYKMVRTIGDWKVWTKLSKTRVGNE